MRRLQVLWLAVLSLRRSSFGVAAFLLPTASIPGRRPLAASSRSEPDPSHQDEIPSTKSNFSIEEKLKKLEQEVISDARPSPPTEMLPLSLTLSDPIDPTTPTETSRPLSLAIRLLLGTYVSALVLSDSLAHFEWFQTWRYAWPFGIGAFYLLPQNYLQFGSRQRWTAAVLGLGLIVGGAADAFLPVYVTGPNVVTNAGMSPDAALGLFCLTFYQIVALSSKSANYDTGKQEMGPSPVPASLLPTNDLLLPEKTPDEPSTMASSTFLLQVLLLAELYKLGEGSFDELLFSRIFGG